MTLLERRFIDEYLIDQDAKKAAIRAGYSKNSASSKGCQLLNKPEIVKAIAERQEILAEKLDITPEKIAVEYARIAFSNMKDFVEWDTGKIKVKPSEGMTRKETACISEISETSTMQGTTVNIKLHNKKGALDSLAKLMGMVIEKKEISGPNGGPIPVKNQEIDLSGLSNEELAQYKELTQKLLKNKKSENLDFCEITNDSTD